MVGKINKWVTKVCAIQLDVKKVIAKEEKIENLKDTVSHLFLPRFASILKKQNWDSSTAQWVQLFFVNWCEISSANWFRSTQWESYWHLGYAASSSLTVQCWDIWPLWSILDVPYVSLTLRQLKNHPFPVPNTPHNKHNHFSAQYQQIRVLKRVWPNLERLENRFILNMF